jgi:YaiO family outer membrane protein
MAYRRFTARLAAALLSALSACALAQVPKRTHATIEAVYTHGSLSGSLPNAEALNLRFTYDFDSGDVLRAEVLDERKFSSRGGLAGLSYTRVLSPDWMVAGTVLAGHGGIHWPTLRVDVELSRKWTEKRNVVTRAALYRAQFDNHRSDRGLRLALVGYLPASVVLEGGVIFNVSDPGSVHSRMPFFSATYGQAGVQYFSLRAGRGSEAYQAIGAGQQLVDFKSRSVGANWRRWIDRQWGFVVEAEHYHNPSYERTTLGAGVFAQW